MIAVVTWEGKLSLFGTDRTHYTVWTLVLSSWKQKSVCTRHHSGACPLEIHRATVSRIVSHTRAGVQALLPPHHGMKMANCDDLLSCSPLRRVCLLWSVATARLCWRKGVRAHVAILGWSDKPPGVPEGANTRRFSSNRT